MESASRFFLTLADLDERRAERGTGWFGRIEGGRDISLIDMSDVAVVMVGDEEDRDGE